MVQNGPLIFAGNLDIHKMIYEPNRFVAVGELAHSTSTKRIQWEEQVVGNNTISHIVYANDFLLSNGMKIYRSSDTLVWGRSQESDIKLLAKIGTLTFGFKGQIFKAYINSTHAVLCDIPMDFIFMRQFEEILDLWSLLYRMSNPK